MFLLPLLYGIPEQVFKPVHRPKMPWTGNAMGVFTLAWNLKRTGDFVTRRYVDFAVVFLYYLLSYYVAVMV